MIRIVVTGSECTGKTTLAAALAERYGTAWVPEYLREFVERKQAPPEKADIEAIARGQMRLEDEHAATAAALLIHDTDLVSMLVYNRHYHGHCPDWIDAALRARAGDLYLLADIDVPWVADGLRDRPREREHLQALFRQALENRGLRYVELSGSHEARLAAAIDAIDELLAGA